VNKDDKIDVAGHRGLAGSALMGQFERGGYRNLVTRTHAELDLTDQAAVRKFFSQEQPEHVFLAAAKVGGIQANHTQPADFIGQNLAIEHNVIDAAWRHDVKRLLFLGSSCIYPRDCAQPIKESCLLTGPLEATNRPYAIAKIAGIEMCWALNRQHRTRFLAAMPTNLYGPADDYDLNNSHVLPALIRKAHEATTRGDAEMMVWGTGAPRREFLFSDDMADACIRLMELPDAKFDALINPPPADWSHPPLINIGCGEDQTIRELAQTIADIVGFKGKLSFDTTKPDGAPRKLLDISRMAALGWQPRVGLREGIALAYKSYVESLH
jgi:GDP-L-fucose synthase